MGPIERNDFGPNYAKTERKTRGGHGPSLGRNVPQAVQHGSQNTAVDHD